MSQQDPFYDIVVVHEKAPEMVSLPKGARIYPFNEPSLEAIREIVREEVQKAMVEIVNKIKAQTGAKF